MVLITAQQSRDARRELGLSQADVTKALDLNRQYLSEFETGFSTRLTASQLKKLRTFYEEKITEANANGEKIELTFGEDSPPIQEAPKIEHFSSKRITIAVADDVPLEVLATSLDLIRDNDIRIAELLDHQAERDDGYLGSGDFTASSKEDLQEIYGLLSLNYIIYRSLGGWPALMIPPSKDSLASIRDIVFTSFKPQLEAAGLIATSEEAPE